ncbi:MAG: hypothetical protein GX567_17735 [Clostridia bacterium]|nr:hypothetical protein [Clostridia bacterium]
MKEATSEIESMDQINKTTIRIKVLLFGISEATRSVVFFGISAIKSAMAKKSSTIIEPLV